jgi:transcriptional regulator with XRE-family HTH domain
MNLSNSHRAVILKALRDSGVTKTELAEKMGFGKSWVTKLLNGTLQSVSDTDAIKIQELLNIQFYKFEASSKVSALAIEVDKKMSDCQRFTDIIRQLLELMDQAPLVPRYFETKEMSQLGREIIRIACDNEDKPGKVAREVLKLISQ